MFYGFKADAKTLVDLTVQKLYGRKIKFKVTGHRASESDLQTSVPRGHYVAQLHIEGRFVAQATDRDWRKSYKLLKIEVERVHAEEKGKVTVDG